MSTTRRTPAGRDPGFEATAWTAPAAGLAAASYGTSAPWDLGTTCALAAAGLANAAWLAAIDTDIDRALP